ncbi:hypothetical protein [Comamonas aquatica]|uniref:hypothetical protein n=1 Tax=Comamonas aquatica TaxID=225991 RepID=UPI003D0705DF
MRNGSESGLPTAWEVPIGRLLAQFAYVPGAAVWVMLPSPAMRALVHAAVRHAGLHAIDGPEVLLEEEVRDALAQASPAVVICPPEVFGWVSKLAFLQGCRAVYTCGEEGAGSLLDRAAHFAMAAEA